MREHGNTIDDRTPERLANTAWFTEIVLVLGVWLVLSSLVFRGSASDVWDGLFVGLLLIIIGAYDVYEYKTSRQVRLDDFRLVAILGLWLIAFSLDFGNGYVLMWDDFLVGSITLCWSLVSYRLLSRRRSS